MVIVYQIRKKKNEPRGHIRNVNVFMSLWALENELLRGVTSLVYERYEATTNTIALSCLDLTTGMFKKGFYFGKTVEVH